jgi:hypothetical protein
MRVLQNSAVLGGLMVAGPAFTQCASGATGGNGTTICTDADADGLTGSTAGTWVIVATSATIRPSKAGAAILSPSPNPGYLISGLVNGGGNKGGLFAKC